jgi:hypothetical protein
MTDFIRLTSIVDENNVAGVRDAYAKLRRQWLTRITRSLSSYN